MKERPAKVVIERAALKVLVDVAGAALDDLETGLEDGTYDEDAFAGHASAAIQAACDLGRGVL